MKRTHLVLLIALWADPISACTCGVPPTSKLFASSDAVFLATATQVVFLEEDSPEIEPRIEVHFKVEKSWKGAPLKTLPTRFNKASCDGYFFKESGRYLVFAKRVADSWVVGTCSVFSQPELVESKVKELELLVPASGERPNH